MKTLFVAAVLLAAGWAAYQYSQGRSPLALPGSSQDLVVRSGDLQATFGREGALSESHLIVGGTSAPGILGAHYLAGLTFSDVTELSAQYPDFFQCDSAGAETAKARTHDFQVIPATPQAGESLRKVLAGYEAQQGAGHVCVKITGERLSVKSFGTASGSATGTVDFPKGTVFLHLASAEPAACPPLAAPAAAADDGSSD